MTPRARPEQSRTPSESNIECGFFFSAPPVLTLFLRPVCLSHGFFDFSDDGLTQEQIDEIRIELCARAFRNGAYCFLEAARVTVASAICDRIERVRNRDDARLQRNPSALQSTRIAGPVP